MASKRNIKQGGGADIRSAVYPQMGELQRKPRGIARPKPFRGQKQRSYRRGGRSSR